MSEINLNWLQENFTDNQSVIFDIGCADMHDTITFRNILPNATCYAFECNKDWELDNIAKAKEHNINYHHMAITNHDGVETFYPSEKLRNEQWPWSGSTCKPKDNTEFEWGTSYVVSANRLDTFCDTHNISPTLIHIDVQGAEHRVLSCLGKHRPLAIWAEICEFESVYNTGVTYNDFIQLMMGYGYKIAYKHDWDNLFVLAESSLTKYNA